MGINLITVASIYTSTHTLNIPKVRERGKLDLGRQVNQDTEALLKTEINGGP